MSSEGELVDRAEADYAIVGGSDPAAARESAAARFRAHVAAGSTLGARAVDAFAAAVGSEPWWRGAAAVRALSTLDAARTAAVARAHPHAAGVAAAVARCERARLAAASPTALVAALAAAADDETRAWTLDALAAHDELAPIREWVRAGDGPTRTYAAALLALAGDAGGLAALLAEARTDDAIRAARACARLADLAHPDGVAPLAALLARAEGDARALAVSAAAAYRTVALGPALAALVDATADELAPDADEPLLVLAQLAAVPLDDLGDDLGDDPAARREGAARGRAALAALARTDPALRVHDGAPLTLAHLAEDLVSPHAGVRRTAAWNLRAITGEAHGYDERDDLIANLDAIAAWRRRAENPAPLAPGGWAFCGAVLPPPPAPGVA